MCFLPSSIQPAFKMQKPLFAFRPLKTGSRQICPMGCNLQTLNNSAPGASSIVNMLQISLKFLTVSTNFPYPETTSPLAPSYEVLERQIIWNGLKVFSYLRQNPQTSVTSFRKPSTIHPAPPRLLLLNSYLMPQGLAHSYI